MAMIGPSQKATTEYFELVKHIFWAALMFGILLLPTLGFSYFSDWLSIHNVGSKVTIYALEIGEYILLGVNSLAFLVSVIAQAVRTFRRTTSRDA
jgi:hypothetical protein